MRSRPPLALLASTALIATALFTPSARAQDDGALLELLQQASSFRVRVSAALALGHQGGGRAIDGLEAALHDPHPAVRAAAAVALAESGTARCVPALREAAADRERVVADEAKAALRAIATREVARGRAPSSPPVPRAETPAVPAVESARFAIVLGDMREQDAHLGLEPDLREAIAGELGKVDSVAVFAQVDASGRTAAELTRRHVPTFRIDGSVSRVQTLRSGDEYRTRCEVSLILMDEHQRTLRGVMKGAATSSEQPHGDLKLQQRQLARNALKSAVRSAMSTVLQAMEAASAQAEPGAGEPRPQALVASRRARH